MTPKTQTTKKAAAPKRAAATANDKKIGVNIHVPAALHRRFRIAALEADMTLADAIIAAMTDWAKK
jgi:hypothetical protein